MVWLRRTVSMVVEARAEWALKPRLVSNFQEYNSQFRDRVAEYPHHRSPLDRTSTLKTTCNTQENEEGEIKCNMNPIIKIRLSGSKIDEGRAKKWKTSVVENNGFNPSFSNYDV